MLFTNWQFRKSLKLLRNKHNLRLLKITSKYKDLCPKCFAENTNYTLGCMKCSCGQRVVTATIAAKTIIISGEKRSVPVFVGRCPACNHKVIGRKALYICPQCQKDGEGIWTSLPANCVDFSERARRSSKRADNPFISLKTKHTMLVEINPITRKLFIIHEPMMNLQFLQCLSKLVD